MADKELPGEDWGIESEEDFTPYFEDEDQRFKSRSKKNSNAISKFIGKGPYAFGVCSGHWYYRDLLAWSVKGCLEKEGWDTLAALGYSKSKPMYKDIQIDYEKYENCLVDGQLMVEKQNVKIIITVDALPTSSISVQLEAPAFSQQIIDCLAENINKYAQENNFYRAKHISLENIISFVKSGERDWSSVNIEPAIIQEIRNNTIGFLSKRNKWPKYGIPTKRGIILAGESGTGKTIICKALMSEAKDTTCIVCNAYLLRQNSFLTELYRLAQDLSPCIVFVEDLDMIGHEVSDDMHSGEPPLVALLAEMDGIIEKKEIITVATTNHVDVLDKALTERPARFDRIIRINRPSYELRISQIKRLAEKIPLTNEVKDYLAKRTEGFTPAQVQETIFGMVIANPDLDGDDATLFLKKADIDKVISEMNLKKNGSIGFTGLYKSLIDPQITVPCSSD
jgi:cell division protease FtsH